MSVEEEVLKAFSKRFEKEQFVSGLTGGTLSEINTVTLVGLVPSPKLTRLITVCIHIMGGITNKDESSGL